MVLKALTGRGMQVEQSTPRRSIPIYVPRHTTRRKDGGKHGIMMPYGPPPYIGSWADYQNPIGYGIKKKPTKRKRKGKGLLLGPNSPFNQIPFLGAIL